MITHYAHLQLNTVSIQGIKQFYDEMLEFPIEYETEREICFRPTKFFTLSFIEQAIPLTPAHIAFEVPSSLFNPSVRELQKSGVVITKGKDGNFIRPSGASKSVYFRDVDGNLLEIISHSYIREDVLLPNGKLNILYLREVGFPVDDVVAFRNIFVELFGFHLDKVYDNFTFAIGGTAHMVIASKKRRWIPIDLIALPPNMRVCFGASDDQYVGQVMKKLTEAGIDFKRDENGALHFNIHGYDFQIIRTDFLDDVPKKLNLPHK